MFPQFNVHVHALRLLVVFFIMLSNKCLIKMKCISELHVARAGEQDMFHSRGDVTYSVNAVSDELLSLMFT